MQRRVRPMGQARPRQGVGLDRTYSVLGTRSWYPFLVPVPGTRSWHLPWDALSEAVMLVVRGLDRLERDRNRTLRAGGGRDRRGLGLAWGRGADAAIAVRGR